MYQSTTLLLLKPGRLFSTVFAKALNTISWGDADQPNWGMGKPLII